MDYCFIINDRKVRETKKVSVRVGFGRGLLEVGRQNYKVVAACADLTGSIKMDAFAAEFPERFVQVGIGEQNLVTVGSGLAAAGKIPFVGSYAAFVPGRCWEQIRTTICINNQPVKIIGSHAGVSVGPDGATHQMLEDIAMMRALPNMVVLAPCDHIEAEKMVHVMAQDLRPNYMRLSRDETPVITTVKTPFMIGEAYVFREGADVTIISTGTMTHQALAASEILHKDGISAEVIHAPTIKPLDGATILRSVKKTGRVITVEEAQIAGGLGGAVAELLCENLPTPLRRIGVQDRYGESGTAEELLKVVGLTTTHIALATHELMSKK
jgi:transketolase